MRTSFRKIENYIFIILFFAVSVSCVTTKSINIEIPSESNKELPKNIQSLTLVSRTVDDSYSDLESDSLQKIFYLQNFNYDTIINDKQAVDTTLKALGELLFESGRYDIVIPEDRFLPFKKNSFLTLEMPWSDVKELCKTYNTDAVLSMDLFKTRVSTKYEKESFYEPSRDAFSSASYAQITIYYEVLFRVYDPAREKVLMREFLRDTITWEDEAMSTGELFDRLSTVKTALSEAGIAVALDLTDIISTVWLDEKRQYFSKGDSDLKHASLLVASNNWDSAMAIWNDIAEKSKSKSVRSKAEFNLAVGYELKGDLQQAIFWALKSYDTMYRTVTYDYLEVLERRKNELKKQKP
jgi:hypothetical protein